MVYLKKVEDKEALFLNRTGLGQNIITTSNKLQSKHICSEKIWCYLYLSSVRSLREKLKPGDMVIPINL